MLRPITACAILLALPAITRGSVSVSCDGAPGGVASLVIESDGGAIQARETDAGIVVEVADPGDDLAGGALRCPPARGVQVVPGRVLGLPSTRILVTTGDRRPSIVRADGRVRLLWLPERLSAARTEAEPPPVAPSSEAEREPPPAPSAPPSRSSRVTPPAPAPEAPAAPTTARPSDPNAPPDMLPLERPVTMVASMPTELREGPGRRFRTRGSVAAGDRITADARAGDWLRTTSGQWVFGPYFDAPEDALQGGAFLARVEAINSPVHAGPAAQHEIVAELYRGEQVVIDELKSEWAHVRDGGWVRMSELTRLDGQASPK